MRHLFFLYTIILFTTSLNAQRVTVSDKLSIRSERAYEILGKINDRFLFYREQPNKMRINAFNEKLKKTWEKELEFDKKRVNVIGLTSTQKDFSIFYTFQQKGQTVIKVQTYNERAILKDSSTIATYDRVFGEPKYKMILSEDKSKALLYYIKDKDTFRGLSFDTKTKEALWFHQFSFEKNNFYDEYQKIVVNNEGGAYLIIGQNNRKSKMDQHEYMVYQYQTGMQATNSVKFSMQNKMTVDVSFAFDNKNKALVAGGLFATKSITRAEGYFSLRIRAEDINIYDLDFHQFEETTIKDIAKDKVTKKNSVEDLRIRDLILKRDGGIVMLFEFTKEYSRQLSGNRIGTNGGRFTTDYYLEDLIIIALHPSGQKHWQQILRKKQQSQDDNAIYSSCFIFKTPSALRLIFNDDINYENTVSEYIVNPIGKYERNSVLSTENQELRLRFKEAIQITANELLVPSESKGEVKLVRITF